MKIGAFELNQIYTGDARELARGIPDESVDLIFTDPVYDRIDDYRWLAETAARVLRIGGSCLAFSGNSTEIECAIQMFQYLKACPRLAYSPIGPIGRLFEFQLQVNQLPLLWFSKGLPDNDWMSIRDFHAIQGDREHKWSKNAPTIWYRLSRFTNEGAIVFDPFTGSGTVPAVCKMLGRNCIAFEIDPSTAERARERVRNTQPPLFVLQPEQIEMDMA